MDEERLKKENELLRKKEALFEYNQRVQAEGLDEKLKKEEKRVKIINWVYLGLVFMGLVILGYYLLK